MINFLFKKHYIHYITMSPLVNDLNLNVEDIEEIVLYNLGFGITEEQTLNCLVESGSISQETLIYYKYLHE